MTLDPHEYLTDRIEEAVAEGHNVEALLLSVARDALDTNETLLQAIKAHRFDTEHLVEKLGPKGYKPRLADQMLYEAAGLAREFGEPTPRCVCPDGLIGSLVGCPAHEGEPT